MTFLSFSRVEKFIYTDEKVRCGLHAAYNNEKFYEIYKILGAVT